MVKPTVLFLFNSSSYAVQPWLDDGRFNVVSVDYDDTDHSAAHTPAVDGHIRVSIDLSQIDAEYRVFEELAALDLEAPSLVVSFAPCTDLAVSGARWFKQKAEANPDFQATAVRMAKLASRFGCAYAVENPVSMLSTLWRKPDFTFHPYEFSEWCPEGPHPEFPDVIPECDMYHKKTCLWVGNGFVLPEKSLIGYPAKGDNPGWEKLGGKSARTKYIRSLTPRGFANAVYASNVGELLRSRGLTERFSDAKVVANWIGGMTV